MKKNKIGILHVINSFEVGGAEYLLKNICRKYDDKDTELIVAYFTGHGTILQGVERSHIVYDLSKDGKFTPLSIFSLVKIIKRHKIKILHTHDPQSGILSRFVAYVLCVKFIVTTRHNPDLIGNYPFLYKIENYLLSKSDVIIAISEAVQQRLLEYYNVPPVKIRIIHNGVDISQFIESSRCLHKKKDSTVVIGTIARLTLQKGIDILINAFHSFSQSHGNTVLYIGGDGPEKIPLMKLVDSLNLQDKIQFVGMLTQQGVVALLDKIDIFVLPSRWEGFGISLIEAMAMGKPVIGSDVDGIREIIHNKVNGLLFPKENIYALADCLKELSENDALQFNLGEKAQETVRSKFTIEKYCIQLADMYRSLLTNNSTHED